jgi:hypothetical protein
MMFKRVVGIDFVDFLIQAGATIAAAVMLSAVTFPHEEFGVATAFFGSFALLAWRRNRALKNVPPVTTGEMAAERLAELEARVAELEQSEARLLELEERLDFAERILSRQRELERLPGPGGQS